MTIGGTVIHFLSFVALVGCNQPNILFILADDMAQWAARAYGNPEIYTPNIDQLASEGLKFTNAFCNTPVCSASRATILTGRLPSQHGVHDWISVGNGCGDDYPGIYYTLRETAYTDILAQNSYTCAISGKYHLGDQTTAQHSFSHWFVHQSGGGSYIDPPMVKNLQCVNASGYVTDIITDDAIEFLIGYSQCCSNKPFYLSVHYTAPHSPYVGPDGRADSEHPKDIVDLYDNATFVSCPQEPRNPYAGLGTGIAALTDQCLGNRECLKGYYAAVTAMDLNIGRLMDTLLLLDLDQDTLVVFGSDHGFNAGHHGLWGKGNAAYPLNMFETSIRVPMIWRHKGRIAPGVEESVVQWADVAPTLLQYAGNYTLPAGSMGVGETFVQLLLEPAARNTWTNRTIYGEYGQTRYARVNASVKYVTRNTGQLELYDLLTDGNETVNLLQPFATNLNYTSMATTFELALRLWFSYLEDPYLSGWTMPVTGKGQRRSVLYNTTGWPNTPAFEPYR